MITHNDIKAGIKLKQNNGIVFVVDSLEEDREFGTLVRSSLVDGKKGYYRDSIEDFVIFMNEYEAIIEK